MEQQTKDVMNEMRDKNKENVEKIDSRFFIYEQKVKEILLMREYMQKVIEQMEESKAYVTKLCEGSIATMSDFNLKTTSVMS